MNGLLLKILVLDNTFMIILLRIFRIGFSVKSQINLNEYSIILGIYKFDIKLSINKLKDVLIRTPEIHGNA
jgi:hypothetical protein|tara:strand:+ start:16366 stop:16578 length:213 start_codon:yes stop_codon:yes gene_type:complete